MDLQSLEQLRNKVTAYVLSLKQRTDFSHLQIDVTVDTDESLTSEIATRSNSSLSLKNSIKATNEISDEVRMLKKALGISTPLVIDISFQKVPAKLASEKKEGKNKGTFKVETPKYKLKDVILPEETRKEIDDTIAMLENFDMVYDTWNFREKEPSAKTNICFYGAPGTGKTMCAHGIAEYLGVPILIASYADIQSEYVGVGPKNLREVFKVAEEKKALLFFDEADSFLRKRTSDTSSSAAMHYNSMTNEMMKHLEDFNGIVIFATNLTENTDEAFKTRLASSVEFKVPDKETRVKLIKYMIPEEVPLEHPFSEEDYAAFAKECEGFVGRDIRNAVKKILCKGAHAGKYPFTSETFIEGFKEYYTTKNKFDESISGKKKKGVSPLDIYNGNGSILTLLTYAVWFDGKETDEESAMLRKYSKILSRNKPVINKLSDLPELEEICDEIKVPILKSRALEYIADILSISGEDDANKNFISRVVSCLQLSDEYNERVISYYENQKAANTLKKGIEITDNKNV